MKPRVLVTRRIPETGLEMLRGACAVDVREGDLPPSRDELIERVPGARGLLCLLTDPVDAGVIAAGADLSVISTYAVGFDNIDVAAATARGIPVGNTPGVLTETTADLAWSLLMSAARRIVEGADFSRAGKWKTWGPTLLLGRDVHGATLGLHGFGRIGRAMARRAGGFGMRVLYCDPNVPGTEADGATPVDFDTLLRVSDFLSLHAPLTPATRGLLGAAALARMKPGAVLINTARGPMVDHDALLDGLRGGNPGYAALDVTDPEPLPAGHPLYVQPNCLIVPHLGSASVATRTLMARMAAENLLAGLRDEPLPNCVNPQVRG
ncbi:MAG TPA: D-glycerate dehydrogenase [Polyangia bacterium]|nr:D-glycerate dehydrogenase [Polyangia bacterium]